VSCEDQEGGGACFVLRIPCDHMYSGVKKSESAGRA
jgi:hypothetical protein